MDDSDKQPADAGPVVDLSEPQPKPVVEKLLQLGQLLWPGNADFWSPAPPRRQPRQPGKNNARVNALIADVQLLLGVTEAAGIRDCLKCGPGKPPHEDVVRLVACVAYAQFLTSGTAGDMMVCIKAAAGSDDASRLLVVRGRLGALCSSKAMVITGEEYLSGNQLHLGPVLRQFFLDGMPGSNELQITPEQESAASLPTPPPAPPPASQPAPQAESDSTPAPAPAPIAAGSPSALYAQISSKVVGIDSAVRTVCARLALHTTRAQMIVKGQDPGTPNECLLVIGPSGCGKTYLAEQAGAAAGLPFASFSATDLTAEGYVGMSVEQSLQPLITAAGGDPGRARFGICFLDEWDKKAVRSRDAQTADVGGRCVQQDILRIMEGCVTQVGGRRNYSPKPVMFNSKGTFFVFAGAFVGLEDCLVKAKKGPGGLGFAGGQAGGPVRKGDEIYEALVDYGMIPEFVNRLTGILRIPEPTAEQLVAIAKGPTGILSSYGRVLLERGIHLACEHAALEAMAEYAMANKTYSRGMKSIISRLVEEAIFPGKKKSFQITAASVAAVIAADLAVA